MLHTQTLSTGARERMLSLPREPLFFADWLNVVMIHLEVEPRALQSLTPFELDSWEGRAFVTLVAFSLRKMRPRFGGRLGRILFRPLAAHDFLNVRTYVRHGDETGIHFLAEWLNNPLAVQLGPRVFSLPYHLARIDYKNEPERNCRRGKIEGARTGTVLDYRAESPVLRSSPATEDGESGAPPFEPCPAGSLDEWLMERYTAFNCVGTRQRFFRVWHEPWPQIRVEVSLSDRRLLVERWPLFHDAAIIGANYSPGVRNVWMGWPHKLRNRCSVRASAVPNEGVKPAQRRFSSMSYTSHQR